MDFSWLLIVPVLGLLVLVHEAGHFFSARLFGIRVEEFGIGLPPRIAAIRRNGIDYSINWLPIGGFVKILGENGDSDAPDSFPRAPAWQRIIVLAAGVTMNMLTAIILFFVFFMMGKDVIAGPPMVGAVTSGKPAAVSGLQAGDIILAVQGQAVSSPDQVVQILNDRRGQPTDFRIDRGGTTQQVTITAPAAGVTLGGDAGSGGAPMVGDVTPGKPADRGGLQANDIIVAIAGQPVHSTDDVKTLSDAHRGQSADFTIVRSGSTLHLTITPDPDPKNLALGISFSQESAHGPLSVAALGLDFSAYVQPGPLSVQTVDPNSSAARAGLQSGDLLVAVNGKNVPTLSRLNDVLNAANKQNAKTVTLVYSRNGATQPAITVEIGTSGLAGVVPVAPVQHQSYGAGESFGNALQTTWSMFTAIPVQLAQVFTGKVAPTSFAGPIGIAQITGEVARQSGFQGLLWLTALLGVNLALINILPLPALDGGRILFILVEIVRGGRKIAPEKEGLVHLAGMAVLLLLILLISINDIMRVVTGGSLIK